MMLHNKQPSQIKWISQFFVKSLFIDFYWCLWVTRKINIKKKKWTTKPSQVPCQTVLASFWPSLANERETKVVSVKLHSQSGQSTGEFQLTCLLHTLVRLADRETKHGCPDRRPRPMCPIWRFGQSDWQLLQSKLRSTCWTLRERLCWFASQ